MAAIRWIKINVDMFDDEKIRIIQSMPEGDALLVIWIKLITLAGKTNDNGYIYIADNIPYTEEMLAIIMNKPLLTIRLAIETFTNLQMIDTDTKGIYLVNFEKHQSIDKMAQIKEQNRVRQARFKEKKRLLSSGNVSGNVTVTQSNATDIEEDKDIDKEKENIDYKGVTALYNSICVSYPSLRTLSEQRKKAIKARLKVYTIDDFKTLFEKAEASDFLKGSNGSNWSATFDWLIKDANMAKVLDGNYDNKQKAVKAEKSDLEGVF